MYMLYIYNLQALFTVPRFMTNGRNKYKFIKNTSFSSDFLQLKQNGV